MRKGLLCCAAAVLVLTGSQTYAFDAVSAINEINAALAGPRLEAQIRADLGFSDDVDVRVGQSADYVVTVYQVNGLANNISEEMRVISGESLTGTLAKKDPVQILVTGAGEVYSAGNTEFSVERGKSGGILVRHAVKGSPVGALPVSDESLILTKGGYILQVKRI